MKRQHKCILLAFIIGANLRTSYSLPVPEDELDTSTRLLGSRVEASVSVVTDGKKDGESSFQSRRVVPGLELPASPAGLLRPDKFQFYTLNKNGEVVTKQMTELEIQSLIAAGGGHFPTEIHDTQMAGEVPTGGMKVADVVQNVQKVLKGELSKPTTVMTSVPTIPGHANDEWSSILPSILAGDMESQSLNIPETEIITESKTRDPISEVGIKPVKPDYLDIKRPEVISSGTKLKPNSSSVSSTKTPDSTKVSESTTTKAKPSVSENYTKKPVVTDKGPQDTISSETHYEPIITYSTSKPSTSSEKLSSKPIKSSSDSFSKITYSTSEKPTVFQKPLKPTKPTKPEHKPQISVRPDPGTYEEKPIVSVGPDKFKSSTPSYILLPGKKTQSPSRTTITKKPTTFETSSKPSYSFRPEYPPISYSEIPMIPVQVITVDQVSTSVPQYQKDNSPVFQVLNTISADAVSGSNSSKIGIKEADDVELSKYEHPVFKPEKVTSEKPKTPMPEIVFTGTSSYTKLPELVTVSTKTETPNMVSIVSETHSTSIKIPGLPEIPISTGVYKPITTPRPEVKTTIAMQSTVKNGSDIILEDEFSAIGTTAPSIFATEKEITTQLFESEATTTDLITEMTSDISKEFETTTDYTSETSTIPVPEETQFQKIPDMTPDGQIISPETTAIEKIIETLHHPTENKFGVPTMIDIDTETTDFTTESEFSTKFTILGEETSTPDYTTFDSSQLTTETKSETTEGIVSSIENKMRTSTAPTILNLENSTDGTSKPYEPLPTELADSLSSMISQISETIPSFPPVSQSSFLTEVPLKEGDQRDTESTRVTQGLPDFETTMYKNANVDIDATVSLEDSTETIKNVEMRSSSKPQMETSTTSSTGMNNESVKVGLVSNGPISASTVPSSTVPTSTVSSSTAGTTESLKASSTPIIDQTIKPNDPAQDQIPQSDESQKVSSVNITEKPIIRLSVTESGSTNLPQEDKEDGNTESPVIRIKVSDSVSMINHLLESAPTQTTASYVDLNLPQGGNSSPNNIGSGLIAGFLTGNESSVGPENTSVLSELLTYSNTSPSSKINLDLTKNAENKTKDNEDKPKDIDTKIKDSDKKIQNDKNKDTEDKMKNTDEKTKIEVKSTEEKTKIIDQDKMKVKDEIKTPDNKIQTSTTPVKEFTTEKNLLVSTTNADKIESTTKKVEEIQTVQTSTEAGIRSTEIKKGSSESVTLSSLPQVVTEKEIKTTSEASTSLKNTTSFLQINQTKPPSVIQSTTESLVVKKENKTKVENITGIPALVESSLDNGINETETSASEKMEIAITTTPKLNEETTITTTSKLNEVTLKETTTTPKSSIETEITTPTSNLKTVVTTPTSEITSSEPSKVISQNKTRKPETPVVRIDISPETSQSELPPNVKLTDLPTIDKITVNSNTPVAVMNVSISDDKLPMNNMKPINSESYTSKITDTNRNGTLSSDEKQKKVDAITDLDIEQNLKNSTIGLHEVRIRVNDTAVLVSKIPSVIINETKTVNVDKEVISSSKIPSVSVKDVQIKRTEDEINLMPSEASKNSSKEEQKKSDISVTFNQKNKPSVNNTKLIIVNTTQSDKIIDDKSSISKPVIKPPFSIHKDTIDLKNESAYNKLGEFISIESNKNKPITSVQKKNITSIGTKPLVKPSTDSLGTKPGLSSTRPNLPSKNRPSSHDTISHKPTESTKIKKPDTNTEEKWALIPQQSTSSSTKIPKPTASTINTKETHRPQTQQSQVALNASQSAIGLDGSIMNLDPDIVNFASLCNELAFSFWSAANKGLNTSRSLALSPFGITSLLAMVFLGARGLTSDEMNDVLKLDDVATFNPHLVFQKVTDTVSPSSTQGIADAVFVRELFSDKSKVGKLTKFYKGQAQQFYEGYVEEVNFASISDIVRRKTNLLVRRQTGGRIKDFVKTNYLPLRSPFAAVSANVFQTECNTNVTSSEGRDGEMHFAVSPAIRQRKLIPIPATVYKSGVLVGYEPNLDATAIALGGIDKLVSIIFVYPGQQGNMASGDNLNSLEVRLVKGAQRNGAWDKLLKVLTPRTSVELQVPKFSHRSIVNATAALKMMGLAELFSKHADFKGMDGIGHYLHFADVLQMNLFTTCGDENISSGRHHVEIYPGPPMRNYRKMSNEDEDEDEDKELNIENDSTSQESTDRSSRQIENSENPRLKLDRPFLYFVRHNPTGLILHMGRFNPRLLP